ncbi:MAG: hypothetical protein GX660_11865 [Clostridiaceae bacterium]|nr:hypothetical protein [Clostridiaceae bacterium]
MDRLTRINAGGGIIWVKREHHIIPSSHNPINVDKITKLTMENARLRADLEKVKAERDAAIADIKKACIASNTCAFCLYNYRGRGDGSWPTKHCSPQWREKKNIAGNGAD